MVRKLLKKLFKFKDEEDIQEVEKSVIQIETKLDEWGKRLETLIMEM